MVVFFDLYVCRCHLQIMNCLSLIDQTNSELELYLRKVLKSTGIDVTSINNNAAQPGEQALNGSPGRASNGVELRASRRDVRA